jgi:hypothetical protein
MCYFGEVEPVLHVGRLGESALFVTVTLRMLLKEAAEEEVGASA